MPNHEKREQEPARIIQQAADTLFDGVLAFSEGMLRLGETTERLGESLAKNLLAHKCIEMCAGKGGAHQRLRAEAGEYLESPKAPGGTKIHNGSNN